MDTINRGSLLHNWYHLSKSRTPALESSQASPKRHSLQGSRLSSPIRLHQHPRAEGIAWQSQDVFILHPSKKHQARISIGQFPYSKSVTMTSSLYSSSLCKLMIIMDWFLEVFWLNNSNQFCMTCLVSFEIGYSCVLVPNA